jgi:hypothetical protein
MDETARDYEKDPLDDFFKAEIARLDNIPASQVTPDYIEQQREKKIYPVTKMDEGSSLGGHSEIGLKFFTRTQQRKLGELVDKLMSAI